MTDRANDILGFAKAILHGDEAHRQWLLDAADAFVKGLPIPKQKVKPNDQEKS